MRRTAPVLALLLVLLAGCATVPGASDVTVLRRVGEPALPSAPPGPVRGAGPLETARGWVLASGSSADRHEAARQFLTPQAAGGWDDGAEPTVVSDQVDTVYDHPTAPGRSAVRVRTTRLGVLSGDGAFVERPGPLDIVVDLTETNGQWRISGLPPGTVVRRSDLRSATRPVKEWFTSPLRGLPVGDIRYLPAVPASALPGRAVEELLGGPSRSLAGAAVSALPPGTTLRGPVSSAVDGTVTVDLTRAGTLDDEGRTRSARQVVLTLAGLGVARVRLLLDGSPLLAGRPELGLTDVVAGVPARVLDRGDLPVDPSAEPPAPAPAAASLVVTDGRVHTMDDDRPPTASPDPISPASATVRAATPAPGGQFVAAVLAGAPGRERLATGRAGGGLVGRDVEGAVLTTPSWSPSADECWTVADGVRVVRTVRPPGDAAGSVEPAAVDATALTTAAAAPISALRVSPDGVRLVAVAGGRLLVGAIVRDPSGGARIAAVRVVRPGPGDDMLDGVVDAGWRQPDQIVAVGSRSSHPVRVVSVDGLDLDDLPTTNLTPPVTRVAAAAGRPTLVVDQGGMWSLSTDGYGIWRSVPGATSGSVPAYPS